MARIAIICAYSLPIGMAATTRIMSYSKGLVRNGDDVTVFSYNPSGNKYDDLKESQGVYEGVNYCYAFKKDRYHNKILHALEILWSIVLTIKQIFLENKKRKIDCLIISDDNPLIIWLFNYLAFKIGSKAIFIFDEYPYPIRRKLKNKIPFWKVLSYRIALKNTSGYIGMTKNLVGFYQNIVFRPSLILTSIVDVDRFKLNSIGKFDSTGEQIQLTYMGNMELSKDNVDNILRAMPLILEKYPNAKLLLCGRPNARDRVVLNDLIKYLNISKNVIIDFVKFSEVPNILSNSHLLLSSQPSTKRAEGGFPTKLGEYLASGTPTVVTNVGEISKFVEDGENVFLVPPENPDLYAKKIVWILSNYETAQSVGKKGRILIEKDFSILSAGAKIKKFITNSI
ncbi:MAG: glycosyltransferase [Cytophagia bacterium]|nr:glycosyltransferase [Cytophagia bacterium]